MYDKWHEYWIDKRINWWIDQGINKENLKTIEVEKLDMKIYIIDKIHVS